ncbi:TPA: two pore domain potassium channel family protein [Pseudomonas putida]|jgi:hypothetical protein|uniref:potassium channel family protein n=1 Tax=Pseudomonas sp. Marseille-P9655 TaxID=2866591 RepID=UPI001CE3CAC3|nr:potassium channel family protein [Pseudomonas sp. Marseille-P9655]HEN8726639.1 two pore domain potassium channel family protein [Pseudomonas putida]
MSKDKDLSLLADPFFFGLCFMALIPVFGLLYCFVGMEGFTGSPQSFIDFMYFSTVAVSTLGFGEIAPITEMSRILVCCQVVLGLICAGMFLNACSYKLSERSAAEEKKRQQLHSAREQYQGRKATLLSQHAIVGFRLNKFALRLWVLTTPSEERGEFSFDSVMGLNGESVKDFKFKDLRELHGPTFLLRDSFQLSVVSYFFKELFLLADAMKNLLNFSNLNDWPKLQADCLEFLYAIEHLDYSESISVFEKSNEQVKNSIVNMIANSSDELPKMRGSNALDSYVALFYLAKASVQFGREYMEGIDEVMSSSYVE